VSLILYDLAGADPERRFSPYCWRVRLAIEHKGLQVETIPWRFTDKQAIAFSGQGRVPVLVDSQTTIAGSWKVANHLEQKYPERPSLFGGASGEALARFVESWSDTVLMPAMLPLIITDIFAHLHERDREYFRSSREQRLGMTLEQVGENRENRVDDFRRILRPLRSILRIQPFLGGEAPNYGDYIPFGAFMWARSVSPFKMLENDDPIFEWRGRVLERFDVARNAPGYDN
jgi:glutathione S-transferase